MNVKRMPIEVGQVWQRGPRECRTITRIIEPDGVVLDGVTTQTFDTLRERFSLVQFADGFKPWAGGDRPPVKGDPEVDVRFENGEYAASSVERLNWAQHAALPIVAYRVVERAPVERIAAVLIPGSQGATSADANSLAAELLTDLGYTFAANCWVAPEAGNPVTQGLPVAGYERLARVLERAYEQASSGKGRERHANGLPFHEQPMSSINKALGSIDGFVYQAHKKSLEAKRLPQGRAQAEMLGAINYLAGAVIALDSWANKENQQ
jgi:hypothetical protein